MPEAERKRKGTTETTRKETEEDRTKGKRKRRLIEILNEQETREEGEKRQQC